MYVAAPGIAGLGWPELIIIVLVVLLLFGGKKLPEMARGTGRALRIFKAETKGLMDDDEPEATTPAPTRSSLPSTGATGATAATAAPQTDPASGSSAQPLPPTHTET